VVSRWIPPVSILLLCAALPAVPAVLPTDLEPKIAAAYEPADADERALWDDLSRLEDAIRTSPQRLIAPELDAYSRDVIERLIGEPAPYLRVYLLHDSSLNAAMLPNGMMIVNTGLLSRVRSEAQFAAVLGHEIGHYFRRHALDLRRESRRRESIAKSAASGITAYSETHGGWSQINQAIMLSRFRFSRDLESEADAYGLALMARAGYETQAAATIWINVDAERRASAAARDRRHRDQATFETSTHPPTANRLVNLIDTARSLAAGQDHPGEHGAGEWARAIGPYRDMLLREQILLNDPGASRYLLESLATIGWTGLLRFHEGEVHRLRNAPGDSRKAAAAYAAAVALPDAPPDAWRAHGFSLLFAGDTAAANAALARYLAMKPDAPDATLVRNTIDPPDVFDENPPASARLLITPATGWKKLPTSAEANGWESVWTWNGPQVDRMAAIDGLPAGRSIVSRTPGSNGGVPPFHVGMTSHDLASMLEVAYRTHGVTEFRYDSIEPADFLGGPGVRVRYRYVSGIAFAKRGECVMRIVGGKLYALKLESLANQAFETVAREFDKLVADARLEK
jgi:hypothetical protein